MEFIYWRHPTIPGIKVEEISGGEHYSGALWLEMARQVYCENGKDQYREIGHFQNGAPFLYGDESRISITHCDGLLAVATLPPTPEVELGIYSDRAALGIDAERADRTQILRIRDRFLNEEELDMAAADDVAANIQLWTIKEAAYKACLTDGLDFRRDILIRKLPRLAPATVVYDPKEYGLPQNNKDLPTEFFGEVDVVVERPGAADGTQDGNSRKIVSLKVYSYQSDAHIVTICYSSRCAKYGKSAI